MESSNLDKRVYYISSISIYVLQKSIAFVKKKSTRIFLMFVDYALLPALEIACL